MYSMPPSNLLTWRNVLGLLAAMIVAGCFVVLVVSAIRHFVPPSSHKTCSVFYTFNDHMTHGTEWQVAEDEVCGQIYLPDDEEL